MAVHRNCPICKGRGYYKYTTMIGGSPVQIDCPCLALSPTAELHAPDPRCKSCMGWGYTHARLGELKLCACIAEVKRSPAVAAAVEAARQTQPTHTDWQQDYSHWPGPTLTSFVVDVQLDGKKDGKGDWVLAGRSDDKRKQRFHIDSIEMEQDRANPLVFRFAITATEITPGPL